VSFQGGPVWEGVVHVFALQGHHEADLRYAWSTPIEGSSRRRFYAVLSMPPINSAADTVRAAFVADEKKRRTADS
jgi:hypothetical protein